MPRGRKKAESSSDKPQKESELKKKLNAVCEAVKKSCPSEWSGGDPVVVLRAKQITNIPTFSTGSLDLDQKLGGGYAWGRIIEVYGPESSGKSTLMLHAIANVQKENPENLCALVDSENSFDPMYAEVLGVNISDLLVSQPDSGEHALNVMMELIRNDVKLVIVDSVAALTPRDMFAGQIGDVTIGKHARLMSEGLRSLNTLLSKKKASVIFTNQIRTLIGQAHASMAGSTTGGKALRFYASQRVELTRIGSDTDSDKIPINNIVKAKVAKNKISPPFQQCVFKIRFGKGIDPIEQIIDFALDYNLIEKSGSWLTIDSIGQKLQGREKLYSLLEENKDICDKFESIVMKEFKEKMGFKKKLERRATTTIDKDIDEDIDEDVSINEEEIIEKQSEEVIEEESEEKINSVEISEV